ncbi:MAG: selenide, water dikinase SelD, partial [Candidatus Rokubacteria bacterium]|nr:selenide, water dikinase SelD [Candidatus Rokubacteria bacterium]
VAQECGVRGATDITGFGFLGHAAEMVEASGAGIDLRTQTLPLLDGALRLAEKGHFSGGMKRNKRHVEATLGSKRLSLHPSLSQPLVNLLFESETSGGLLFSVEAARADTVIPRFKERAEPCWEVGEVTQEPGIRVH